MRDMTVGIVGLGSIGRAVGALATAFGCRVIATRRRPDAGDAPSAGDAQGDEDRPLGALMLDRVCPRSGSPSCSPSPTSSSSRRRSPATPRACSARPRSRQLKPGAWLINIARGELVDERALARALRDGPLGGAVLDTFREEPLPPTSPLYDLPNVILTPHTSWSSTRVLDRSASTCSATTSARYAAGEPLLNVVDPNAGY